MFNHRQLLSSPIIPLVLSRFKARASDITDSERPGVVSNFAARQGTGGPRLSQETTELEISE